MENEFDPVTCADQIAKYINEIRANPQSFMPKVQARIDSYEGKNFDQSGVLFQSAEGKDAPNECLACLESMRPKQEMTRMPGLDKAAQDLANFNGESGKTGHSGKEDSRMGERMDVYGKWIGKVGEIIGVIPTNGLDFVLQWMIDDGVKTRGDRKTILNAEFGRFGVACAKHKIYKTIAVVTFAKDYVEKDAEGNLPDNVGPAPKTNDELKNTMPAELKELPEDAEGMSIKRKVTTESGETKTVYTIVYKLKDGGSRELVKEYEGRK